MVTEVKISTTAGTINAPASKSCLQRALALALLARGRSVIHNMSQCDDVRAAASVIRDLGAVTEYDEDTIIIKGRGIPEPVKTVINTGESGLSTRLFIPVASLCDREIRIEGEGTILKRNMDHFAEPLGSLGVSYRSETGFLPVRVRGPLRGGRVSVDGTMSSQFLSGLLIALAATGDESVVEARNLTSRPYIDITHDLMQMAGAEVRNNDYRQFIIKAGSGYHQFEYTAEGDWSGASVFLVMGAIRGSIEVRGLRGQSFQADGRIAEVLEKCGALVTIAGDSVTVRSSDLRPFVFDATDAPDLVPALVVLAMACDGRSAISHIERLRVKESDRVRSVCDMIRSLGGTVSERDNTMLIDGGKKLRGGTVDSYNDHRIVMAASAASLLCDMPVMIRGAESVNKSYPEFPDHLARAGGQIINKTE